MQKNRNFDVGMMNSEKLSGGIYSEKLQSAFEFYHSENKASPRQGPNDKYDARLSFVRSNNGIEIRSYNSFNHNTAKNRSFTNRNYFPSDQYASRIYDSSDASDTKNSEFSSLNMFTVMRGKHSVYANLDINANNNISRYRRIVSDIADGIAMSSADIKDYNKSNLNNISLALSDTYHLKNNKGSIYAAVNGNFGRSNGDGWRVDDLATSTFRTHLTKDIDGKNKSFGGKLGLNSTFLPKTTASIYYAVNYTDKKSRQISYDNLLFQTDILNTYDYTLKSVENRVGIDFSAFERILSAKIGFSNKHMLRDERFPGNYEFPRVFNSLSSSVTFDYPVSPLKKIYVNFNSSASDISIEQLRGVIDNSNPLMLRAGNPDLKQPLNNRFSASYDIVSPSAGSSYGIKFDVAYTANYIAYKTRYFTSDVNEYWGFAYPFTKGTTFMIPDNVGGRWDMKAGINYKKRIELLRSTLSAELNYDYSRTPYLIEEEPKVRLMNGGSLALGFISGFSNKISIILNSTTSAGTTNSVSDNSRYFNQQLSTHIRTVIKEKYTFQTSATYSYAYYSATPDFIRNEVIWNAGAGRKFGKKNKLEVTAKISDILNKTDTRKVSIVDNYVQTSTSWFLGRSWMVELTYKF